MVPTGHIALALALVSGAATGAANPLPSCAPSIEISDVRAVRVEQNGVIVLDNGRAVHLEGILLPAGVAGRAPDFLLGQAVDVVSTLVIGHAIKLAVQPPNEDRYGRLRAQVFFADGSWLQTALLAKGLARVDIAPDRRECAPLLYAAETGARKRKLGIWAQRAYALRSSADAANVVGSYQVIEGRIVRVEAIGGRVYLEFGLDRRKTFAGVIAHGDLKAFRESGIDPFSYATKRVRIRGWVERRERIVVEIAVPEAIEVLDSP